MCRVPSANFLIAVHTTKLGIVCTAVSHRKLAHSLKMGRDRHKLLKCVWCEKEFRSDYLKKHKEKCKKKSDKENIGPKPPKKKNNRPPLGQSFIDNEAVNSESDNETVPEETQADRDFIDDEYHSEDNSEEVRIRLAQLQRAQEERLRDHTECKHCKTYYPNAEISAHQANCKERKVNCFKCTRECYIYEIKKHIRDCRGKKPQPPKKKPTKQTSSGSTKKNKGPKKGRKKKNKGGTQFKLQFHGAKKYKIVKKLLAIDRTKVGLFVFPSWIKQFIIGNEFGSGSEANPHCHAVLVTKKRLKFKFLKQQWKLITGIRIDDIQSCKDIRQEVRYCTKEDYRPVNYNFDWDLCSLGCLAYHYANKYDMFSKISYPYMKLQPWQKKDFIDYYQIFKTQRDNSEVIADFESRNLFHWQRQVETMIKYHVQNDREVTWIVDPVGNAGKSYFSDYLTHFYDCIAVDGNNLKTKDFALTYNLQKVVIIDFPRSTMDHLVNYDIIECLKNGRIWSPKYESQVKSFRHKKVQVFCFSNFFPDYSKLSPDRWTSMFKLENRRLKRFVPELPRITQ